MKRVAYLLFIMLMAFAFAGCGSGNQTSDETDAPTRPTQAIGGQELLPMITIWVGDALVEAEIASSPAAQAQGLSGRAALHEGKGMLFSYAEPLIPTFWMKEMRFPIDIIWIRDGMVVDISPHLPAPLPEIQLADLPRYQPKEPIRYALEVPAGWAARHKVTNGTRVTIPDGI